MQHNQTTRTNKQRKLATLQILSSRKEQNFRNLFHLLSGLAGQYSNPSRCLNMFFNDPLHKKIITVSISKFPGYALLLRAGEMGGSEKENVWYMGEGEERVAQ